ncbi:MAG: hypothetical protein SGJ10_06800 [Bacteroidota bacterium]|nr:hypothetical protein [Bacteroidota bacterium]
MPTTRNLFILLSALTMVSCGSDTPFSKPVIKADSTQKVINKVEEEEIPVVKTIPDVYANQIARYMAGLSQEGENELKNLEGIAKWQTYSKKFDTLWRKLENSRLNKERKWAQTETSNADAETKFLFYPFSGADFMHGYTFFPNARKMVLIGLEPPGSLPEFVNLKQDSGKVYFSSIQKSLFSVMQWSFFRTNSMAKDLKTRELDGTLPLIMIFMARTGNTVLKAQPIYIDSNGKETFKSFPSKNHRGVKVIYKSVGSDQEKELCYYKADIADGGLEADRGFYKLLQSFNFQSTYLKSASYLMHNNYFSRVRSIILEKSKYVLQDDSGIPFKFFKAEKWNTVLYGTYDKPINLFSNRFQKDFKEAYGDSTKVKSLPFGIGYDWMENTSNLMLATKK